MSICSSDATPLSRAISSQKSTRLKRKKKFHSREMKNNDFSWLETASVEKDEDGITKRLNFDDLDLSDDSNETEKKTESAKKRRACMKEQTRPAQETTSRRSSEIQPIRNTCILESPLDHRKSSRKRRVYGFRRNDPKLPRKRPKRSTKRPMNFTLCALQRMFAE